MTANRPAPSASEKSDLLSTHYLSLASLIVFVSLMAQIGALKCGAVIDDFDLIYNPARRGCGNNPLECFRHPVFGLYYRPLMTASFAAGVAAHGTSPYAFHVENLLLHAAVVGLALWLFRLLFREALPALLAGLLFALHPLHVGVTTFIGGRADTLALFFALWFAIGLVKQREAGATFSRLIWRILSLLGFAAAIFTKEQCLPLALLAPLLGSPDAKPAKRVWMLLYAAPAVAYFLAAHRIVPSGSFAPAPWSPLQWAEMVGRTLWYYLKALLFPNIRALHQSTVGPWDTPQPFVALLGFMGGGLWLLWLRAVWKDRTLRIFALWTTLTLFPCLNLFPVPSQPVASYRAVLPLLGLAGMVGAALAAWAKDQEREARLSIGLLVAGVSLAFLGVTLADVPTWRSDLTVEQTQTQADPNFLPAEFGLANSLRQVGRNQEALPLYDHVLETLLPGAQTEAERIALGRSPATRRRMASWSGLHWNLDEFLNLLLRGRGGAYQALGRWDSAAEDFRVALAFRPNDDLTRDALVTTYYALGRYAESGALLRELVARAPTAARYLNLATVYLAQQNRTQARDALAKARTLPADAATAATIRHFEEITR